jgi:hypothetical protein
VLAVGLAFFREYLDTRIKSPDEIRVHLGLPFLGLVPSVGASTPPDDLLISNGVPPKFVEAFRAIRTTLLMRTCGARVCIGSSASSRSPAFRICSSAAQSSATSYMHHPYVDCG